MSTTTARMVPVLLRSACAVHLLSHADSSSAVTQANNRDVYEGSIKELTAGVADGLNGTVFAYGSTGSGKTYTMVGESIEIVLLQALDYLYCKYASSSKDMLREWHLHMLCAAWHAVVPCNALCKTQLSGSTKYNQVCLV